MKIAVIGAGSWGTALAWLLSHNKHEISLWAYEEAVTETIKKTRENTSYLPGIKLNHFIVPTSNIEQALHEAAWVLFVVPSHVSRNVLTNMRPYLSDTTPIVSATKGIERKTLLLVSEVICEVLERKNSQQVAVLSGPSFAKELVQSHPTAVSLATKNTRLARRIENAFATPFFRMFLSSDLIGVQLGGALKNVIALAAGGADGLGFGYNTKAILLTRGLSEMARLGIAMGADINTFYGQSGMGDLFLTCGGSLSRNRAVGEKIGTGQSLESIQKSMNMVAEGVKSTRGVLELAGRYDIEMPIATQVGRVLYEGASPNEVLKVLMGRDAKRELHGIRD